MRASVLVLVAGCTVGVPGTGVPCGAPIEVSALPRDLVVLHDEDGEMIAHVRVTDWGLVKFDRPACMNSVTFVAEYYSFQALYAMTVTSVVPGVHLDLVQGRYVSGADQPPQIPIDVRITGPATGNTYAFVTAPGCSISSDGKGSCSQVPEMAYGFAGIYGTVDPVGYALVPVSQDEMHDGGLTATVDTWRTDFASTTVDVANAFPGSMTGSSVAVHTRGETYATRGGAVPGIVDGIPPIGDRYTIWTSAFLGQVDQRTDTVIDAFTSIPTRHEVDFASVPSVEATSIDDATTISWEARAQPADVTRVCADFSGPFAGWCILVPADQRSATFPCLTSVPGLIAPSGSPSGISVTTIEMSLAASYDNVRREPFASLSIPWSGGPDLTVRASRIGSSGQPWWGF